VWLVHLRGLMLQTRSCVVVGPSTNDDHCAKQEVLHHISMRLSSRLELRSAPSNSELELLVELGIGMADPRNGGSSEWRTPRMGGALPRLQSKALGLCGPTIVCSSMLNQLNKSPNLSHEQHAINGGVDKYNRLKPTCDSE